MKVSPRRRDTERSRQTDGQTQTNRQTCMQAGRVGRVRERRERERQRDRDRETETETERERSAEVQVCELTSNLTIPFTLSVPETGRVPDVWS